MRPLTVPFTAPPVPELATLPAERRVLVLLEYSRSPTARRLARRLTAVFYLAVVLFCVACACHGVTAFWLVSAAVVLPVGGVAFYRAAAAQAVRGILRGQTLGEALCDPLPRA